MRKERFYWRNVLIAVMSLTLAAGMVGVDAYPVLSQNSNIAIAASAEESSVGKYSVNIQLMQFHSTELSMGNASMNPQATIVVNTDGTAQIEIDMQSLTYLGREGYLGWLKKVTKIVSQNAFQYPTEVETEDAVILEEFIDFYDDFNDSNSDYLDVEVEGKWYPKKLAIPIDFDNRDNDILVQVYVPVMESIMPGGGTKFATLDIDWDSLTKTEDFTGSVTTEQTMQTAAQTTTVTTTTTTATTAVTELTTDREETIFSLDKDNLPDGKYELYAEMIKTDRESYSMSNNGINHTVQLEVVDGEYYITVQFKGLAIYNQFGYLMNLYYYERGYTYNTYGAPQGSVTPAEVISTYDVVDQYNDAEHLYPQLLKFPLVDKASGEYVPLQVFVPIMEAIADGTGTQGVLMQLDWSTLTKVDDGNEFTVEEADEQSPEFEFTDTATGVKIHADKGVFAENTTVKVTEITDGSEYISTQSLVSDIGSQFKLYDISLIGEDGIEAKPNGKIQISIPVPSDYANPAVYRISDGKKTLISGTVSDSMFTFSAKETGTYVVVSKSGTSSSAVNNLSVNKASTKTNTSSSSSPKTSDMGIGGAVVGLIIATGAVMLSKKTKGEVK